MARASIQDCLVLDIQKLIRRKVIAPGIPKSDVWFWLKVRRGEIPVDGHVTINSWYPTNGDPALQIFMPDGSTDIIHFRCIDRGVAKRWFFVAPNSEKGELVRKLYLPRGRNSFDTRKAHDIPYPDRNLTKQDRIARQIWKLRASLGFTDDLCGEYGPKPPYMRTKTFKRQCRKLDELEWRRLGSIRLRGRPPKFNRIPHHYAVSLSDTSLAGFGRIERKEMPARGIDRDPGDASADPPIPAKTTGIGISGNSTEILGIFDR